MLASSKLPVKTTISGFSLFIFLTNLGDCVIYKLKDGVVIDGIKVVPKRVKIKKKDLEKNKSKVEVTIVEGRNHIVKKVY